MKQFIFLSALIFVFHCGGLDDSSKKAVRSLLGENQKVHSFLLSHENQLPDIKGLLSVLNSSRDEIKNPEIRSIFLEMNAALSKIGPKNKESFFQSYSNFSVILAGVVKKAGLATEYNKFYCPMVRKTWVASGEEIQNPYAPEMRDCGDLVK